VPLLDNSAWSRLLSGSVPEERAEMVVEQMEKRQLATCLPFLLEAGYSARSVADRNTVMDRVRQLPHVAVDDEVERLAMEAQRMLTDVGHHRLSLTDVVIAACAHRAGSGVLHYDRDYDLIAEHTGLVFESLWIAEAGTL
jgi:predicted nucleic acid-binding protein